MFIKMYLKEKWVMTEEITNYKITKMHNDV